MPDKQIDLSPTRVPRRDLLLWLGMLAGPVAWALQLQATYSLAPTACTVESKLFLHLVSLGCLLLALGGAALARHLGKGACAESRERFMAVSGVVLSLGFALVIVALEVPNWVLRVCD